MKITAGRVTVLHSQPARFSQPPYSLKQNTRKPSQHDQATYLLGNAFVAFVLLLIATLSTPIIPGLSIANIPLSTPNGNAGNLQLGSWGWCLSMNQSLLLTDYGNGTTHNATAFNGTEGFSGTNTTVKDSLQGLEQLVNSTVRHCSDQRTAGMSYEEAFSQLPIGLKSFRDLNGELPAAYLTANDVMNLLCEYSYVIRVYTSR
jgi:hypothetical protein